jgi:uncharacterized protein DUF5678
MSARHARRIEDEPAQEIEEKAPVQGPSTAEEYRAAISAALNDESLRGAQRAAAEGHARFPEDPELARLNRLLTLRPARSVPGPLSPDRTEAFQWLEEHGEAYRGQWIALGDKGLLAASQDLDDLLRTLKEMSPDALPVLLHLV